MKPTVIRSLGAALFPRPKTLLGTIAGMAIAPAATPPRKFRRVGCDCGVMFDVSFLARFPAALTNMVDEGELDPVSTQASDLTAGQSPIPLPSLLTGFAGCFTTRSSLTTLEPIPLPS